MIGSAHVSHVLRVNIDDSCRDLLDRVGRDLSSELSNVTPVPRDDYHVTLGQASYFDTKDVHGRNLQKVSLSGDYLKSDFDYQYQQLKKQKFGVDCYNLYPVIGIRITDNGFIVLKLEANQELANVVQSYHQICSDYTSSCPTAAFSLNKYYLNPTDYDMHVTVAKLNDLTVRESHQRRLQNRLENCPKYLRLNPKATKLSSSYKSYKNRVEIQSAIIDLSKQPNPQALLYKFENSFSNLSLEEPQALIPLRSIQDVKNLIDRFFPVDQRITPDVGVIKNGENYKITFITSLEKTDFCKKFSDLNKGKAKGLCCYDKSDPKHKTVIVDHQALNTLQNAVMGDDIPPSHRDTKNFRGSLAVLR